MPAEPSQLFERAERIASIEVSEIVQITEAATRLRSEGVDVVSLGAGEPDFDTPDHVKQAAVEAIWRGETKYPPTRGTAALHRAVCEKYRRDNDIEYRPQEVIVSAGAKQVIFNAFMASLDPGDEVIIPAPYWTSYSDIVKVCGGVPKVIPCPPADGFKLTAERLAEAVSERTRWLLLNSPSNPAGSVYHPQDLRGLGSVLEEHPRIWLMSDEIYEHLSYSGQFQSARAVLPDLAERTLLVNGVSKAYAMTGWRLGFGTGPAALIAAMTAVQGQITSGICSISQAAAVAALTGPQDCLAERRAAFQRRRDLVVGALDAAKGISCDNPAGAFYVFPSCEGALGRKTPGGKVIGSDAQFCEYLLEEASVAVVPGRAFGSPGFFRISYAYSEPALREAMTRIARACEALD